MIDTHYEGLFRSAGHRANTLDLRLAEIGVAQVEGQFSTGGNTYNASMLTENFAVSGSEVFLTGVAYDDADGDHFYGIGEGLSDVWFTANGHGASTAAAGGYGIGIAADATTDVTLGIGAGTLAHLRVDLSRAATASSTSSAPTAAGSWRSRPRRCCSRGSPMPACSAPPILTSPAAATPTG